MLPLCIDLSPPSHQINVNDIWLVYVILQKKKKYQNFFAKTATWELVPGLSMFAKNKAQPLLQNDFLKWATYVRYVIVKLSKFVQISMQTPSDSFFTGFFEN